MQPFGICFSVLAGLAVVGTRAPRISRSPALTIVWYTPPFSFAHPIPSGSRLLPSNAVTTGVGKSRICSLCNTDKCIPRGIASLHVDVFYMAISFFHTAGVRRRGRDVERFVDIKQRRDASGNLSALPSAADQYDCVFPSNAQHC